MILFNCFDYKNREKILRWCLKRLQPNCEKYVRYKDAVDVITDAKLKFKTRDRMLYLLRKTSDRDSLSTALEGLRGECQLSKDQCKRILKGITEGIMSSIKNLMETLGLSIEGCHGCPEDS